MSIEFVPPQETKNDAFKTKIESAPNSAQMILASKVVRGEVFYLPSQEALIQTRQDIKECDEILREVNNERQMLVDQLMAYAERRARRFEMLADIEGVFVDEIIETPSKVEQTATADLRSSISALDEVIADLEERRAELRGVEIGISESIERQAYQ